MTTTLSSRQFRNRLMADLFGVEKPAWYQTDVRRGDVIEAEVSAESGCHHLTGRVVAVLHHGHYQDLDVVERGRPAPRRLRLWEAGPPDEPGTVTACRVVEREVSGEPDDPVGKGDFYSPLMELENGPERCPKCRHLVNAIPRSGWPCWACQVAEDGS